MNMTLNNECPFCKSNNSKKSGLENTFYNNKVFHYVKCTSCALIYVQPFPNQKDYEVMYPPSYQGEIIEEDEFQGGGTRLFELIRTYSKKKKILDFGCGNGAFLKLANKNNYECFGVEFDEVLVNDLMKKKQYSRFETVKNFEKSVEQFDIIHLSNTLEHLTNPRDVIIQLKKNLTDDGIFIIYGPIENNFNFAFLVRRIFFGVRKSISERVHNHAPTHIFYSNAKNQKKLFDDLGLNQLYFEVSEHPWPFPASLKEANSFSKKVMFFVAKVSQFISSFFPSMGNHFLYIGSKMKSS